MPRLTRNRMPRKIRRRPHSAQPRGWRDASLLCLLLFATVMLSACKGSTLGGGSTPVPLTLSGNWQFTMAQQSDPANVNTVVYQGGLQGGFLLEKSGAATGTLAYSIMPSTSNTPCNSGSAAITGMLNGQAVTLTAVADGETFTLTGTLSLDSSSMSGTYTSVGPAPDGSGCGYPYSSNGPQWFASLIPPLTGPVQGSFHSAGGTSGLNLNEQDFLLSGGLFQGDNTGASAPVTGNVNFINPITVLSDYPCFGAAGVTGTISGNSVVLQIVGPDGSPWGQIGAPVGSTTGLSAVTFDPVHGAVQGIGASYLVSTPSCAGDLLSVSTAGDAGNVCLAVAGAKACGQPIALAPTAMIFASQAVGAPPTIQTIQVSNSSSVVAGNLTMAVTNGNGANFALQTDDCGAGGGPSGGQPFSLNPKQSCTATIVFTPQLSCPNPAVPCLNGTLQVMSPSNNTVYTAALSGTGTNPGVSKIRFKSITDAYVEYERASNFNSTTFQDEERHAETD
jgi:hypothetical protein